MADVRTILVIHPMAIGDVVLGTPVAAALKRTYPDARIVYFTHSALLPLLRLCHAIDEYMEWVRKAPIVTQVAMIKRMRPDLIVDLTSSTRTRLMCFLSGIPYVRYHKQSRNERPVVHVVDRYLQSVEPLVGEPSDRSGLFPTLTPTPDLLATIDGHLGLSADSRQTLIGLVPGVGSLRPHRAWTLQRWIELAQRIQSDMSARVVLIGGPDDAQLCAELESAAGTGVFKNFAGKLSLPETAALLQRVDIAVSGDTGPCHIAVAVGTPVVSMMGPTLQQRSGPYSNSALGFDVSAKCKCLVAKKICLVTKERGAGACMGEISADSVYQRIVSSLKVTC